MLRTVSFCNESVQVLNNGNRLFKLFPTPDPSLVSHKDSADATFGNIGKVSLGLLILLIIMYLCIPQLDFSDLLLASEADMMATIQVFGVHTDFEADRAAPGHEKVYQFISPVLKSPSKRRIHTDEGFFLFLH